MSGCRRLNSFRAAGAATEISPFVTSNIVLKSGVPSRSTVIRTFIALSVLVGVAYKVASFGTNCRSGISAHRSPPMPPPPDCRMRPFQLIGRLTLNLIGGAEALHDAALGNCRINFDKKRPRDAVHTRSCTNWLATDAPATADAFFPELVEQVERIAGRSREPVEPGHHHGIAGARFSHQVRQRIASLRFSL
jgi:hypothetical protein